MKEMNEDNNGYIIGIDIAVGEDSTSVIMHTGKLDIADETVKICKARSDRFGELVDVHAGRAPNRIRDK